MRWILTFYLTAGMTMTKNGGAKPIRTTTTRRWCWWNDRGDWWWLTDLFPHVLIVKETSAARSRSERKYTIAHTRAFGISHSLRTVVQTPPRCIFKLWNTEFRIVKGLAITLFNWMHLLPRTQTWPVEFTHPLPAASSKFTIDCHKLLDKTTSCRLNWLSPHKNG